jgi:hypothetical protein
VVRPFGERRPEEQDEGGEGGEEEEGPVVGVDGEREGRQAVRRPGPLEDVQVEQVEARKEEGRLDAPRLTDRERETGCREDPAGALLDGRAGGP